MVQYLSRGILCFISLSNGIRLWYTRLMNLSRWKLASDWLMNCWFNTMTVRVINGGDIKSMVTFHSYMTCLPTKLTYYSRFGKLFCLFLFQLDYILQIVPSHSLIYLMNSSIYDFWSFILLIHTFIIYTHSTI